jgi:hemolysin activation/secretion protein
MNVSFNELHSRPPQALSRISWVVLMLLAPCALQAAEVDAGALQQQIDRTKNLDLPRQRATLLPKPMANPPRTGLKILVQRFEVNGNTLLDQAQLQPLLNRYQGQELTFSELEALASELGEVFREAGWVVRAYLPEQDVVDGVVRIEIVQARLGEIRFDGEIPKPATPETLKRIVQSQQASAAYLNSPAIDRALLIADDISGVYVNGNLKEGEQEGETDLILKATAKPGFEGTAITDNTGSRGTGVNRLVMNVNFNSVFGDGDQVSTTWTETKASRYKRVGWTVPVGTDGLKIGASTSQLAYEVLQFQETVAPTGSSDTTGIEASYPLLRSRAQNVYASFAIDEKRFKNYSEGQVKSDYSSRPKSLSFYGNSFDGWGGGGSNTANLTFVHGFMNMDGSPNASEVAVTTQTAGAYRKIRYAISRQQVLAPEWSVYGSLSGQRSRGAKNLDSSEKFYLGGSAGVRAYPSSEAGGGNGVMGNIELRWQLQPRLMAATFYDIGNVTLYPALNQQDVTALNKYTLKGNGFSLAWQSEAGIALKLIWARRIGTNPAANIETGKDLDGSLVRTRIWSSVTVPF